MTKRYLEDFAVGQVFKTGRKRVDKDEIFAFAREFDPQPYHLDEEAARRSPFGGIGRKRLAHRRHDHAAHG